VDTDQASGHDLYRGACPAPLKPEGPAVAGGLASWFQSATDACTSSGTDFCNPALYLVRFIVSLPNSAHDNQCKFIRKELTERSIRTFLLWGRNFPPDPATAIRQGPDTIKRIGLKYTKQAI